MLVLAGFVSQFVHFAEERRRTRSPSGVIPLQRHDDGYVFRDTDRKAFKHNDARKRMFAGVELAHQCGSLHAEERIGLAGAFFGCGMHERPPVGHSAKRFEVESECGLLSGRKCRVIQKSIGVLFARAGTSQAASKTNINARMNAAQMSFVFMTVKRDWLRSRRSMI